MHDIYQSKEYNRCTFWGGNTHAWLYGEGFLCENWFELVELYHHYCEQQLGNGLRNRWDKLTPEERSEVISDRLRESWGKRTPEERSEAMRNLVQKRWDKLTPEERSANVKERLAKMTPEQRSEQAKLAWATKRAKKGA
jgi:predicted Fe-S protein YdhL (DUF1289 family)